MYRATLAFAFMLSLLACGFARAADDKDPSRVLPKGQLPKDARLGKPRTLRDKYHPWTPPKTLAEWKKERQRLKQQVLVSQGLWPMPPKTPLKAVIHGKIDRGDYTVEKVYFQSHPGHYVTGNLYRPKGEPRGVSPRRPGVLCPHGHWSNARFYDAGVKNAKKLIAGGGETYLSAARHHIQARMVGLARLGCVVFHYDMVGYSDSKVIGHRQGFTDAEASLRLQNFMGLQTWNSIRALDFLTSLKDVDAKRIGVTGASGGGTQTFMLAAIDPRVQVAFPAVMASTAMQGGCICENAEYLRIGVNNIALAALFAPKPQAMSGADDWTKAIETKGYPELRQVYSLYGKPENISAKAYPQFKHNYNQLAREMMYEWFNRHLKLGQKSPIKERDFKPIPAKELSVWTDKHPQPKDAKTAKQLRAYLTKVSQRQFAKLVPKTKGDVERYREVVRTASRVMFGELPKYGLSKGTTLKPTLIGKQRTLLKGLVGTHEEEKVIPAILLLPTATFPKKPPSNVVDWLSSDGKSSLFGKDGHPKKEVENLLGRGFGIVSRDVFQTGEFLNKNSAKPNVNGIYPGYTFGYNRPLIVERVRDVVAAHSKERSRASAPKSSIIGEHHAGVWVLLASAQFSKNRVDRIIVDLNGFSFRRLKSTGDPNFLPGALKYGGLGGLAALAAPTELIVYGTKGIPKEELAPLVQMYKVTGGKLTLHAGKLTDDIVVKEVLKK